jgi:hypothetical protein
MTAGINTLTVKEASTFETLVNFYHITQLSVPEVVFLLAAVRM